LFERDFLMSNSNYWSGVLENRYSRRRALAGSAGIALGAAALAACGGGGKSSSRSGGASGLLTQPEDTTKKAVRGGILPDTQIHDVAGFDPQHGTVIAGYGIFWACCSQFLRVKPAIYPNESQNEPLPDMAESWEWSPDLLTLTMKLRQGAGWAPQAPVNGRPVTIEDIAYTWKRYGEVGDARSTYFNSLNPEAPILSMTTPDSRTFVFKLAFPFTPLLANFGYVAKNIKLLPVEADSEYDPRTTLMSAAHFYVDKYEPSVSIELKRNPNYYRKDVPFLDGISRPIITEYATQLAQFKAGRILGMGTFLGSPQVRGEDILQTKKDVPALNTYQTPVGGSVPTAYFGFKPQPPEKTPFRDVRVRQAWSMAIDRDPWINVMNNVDAFKAAGIPAETLWTTHLDDYTSGWYLDPHDKNFGPNAKYYFRDVAEAKKLLAAAGYPSGLTVTHTYSPSVNDAVARGVPIIDQMVAEAGFKIQDKVIDDATVARTIRDSRGDFEGIGTYTPSGRSRDPLELRADLYVKSPSGAGFLGFDAAGKGDFSGDPKLEAIILNARKETDPEKRKAAAHEFQRYLAQQFYSFPYPGLATGFVMAWPALKNFGVYRAPEAFVEDDSCLHYWIDKTLPPYAA
ncbi:MAG TPA: ABC transporter substrate-binding protein, partial [Nitrospira sp.]|nr:ABC transporter substrate-binding protein [Nitrospira sp.]